MAPTADTPQQRELLADIARWVMARCIRYAGWAAVRIVEWTWIALLWLDPRMHIERLRLRSVEQGRRSTGSGKIALLLVYADGDLPPFTSNFIDAIVRSDFDLVVVSNGQLSASAHSEMLGRCRLVVQRANVGRDFGGYKDGIALIRRTVPDIRRLLIANDSVFYLRDGLDGLIQCLDGDDEFIGVSEIFEHSYHVASFLVSFGPRAVTSDAFCDFWRRYMPISSRRWAILRGEHALTAALMRAGFQPDVIYGTDGLRSRLAEQSVSELKSEAQSLPAAARLKLVGLWSDGCLSPARMAGDIADAIRARNQMHYGGLLFRRHLGLPLMKRDLVYRGVYSLPELSAQLSDLDPTTRAGVIEDLRRRPPPSLRQPLRWLFYRYGAI